MQIGISYVSSDVSRQSTQNEQGLGHSYVFLSFNTTKSHLLRVSFIPTT